MITHRIFLVVAAALSLVTPASSATPPPAEPLRVLATTPTYGLLAEEIGGDQVEVVTLMLSNQDAHMINATPSLIARARNADLLFYTGLDGEFWLTPLLRQSANLQLLPGNRAAISMSDGVRLKQVPNVLSRNQGDVHQLGNPHIWTDPLVVRALGQRVRDALIAVRPDATEAFTARHAAFDERLTRALIGWLTRYAGLKGTRVVVYHPSWIYFLDRFGLTSVGTVEPKPRVTPTAGHLDALVKTIEQQKPSVVIREPFHHPQATDFLADRTGIAVVELCTNPGFPAEANDIISHFEWNLAQLADALGLVVPEAN